jgi:hypothetical protein
MIGLSSMTAAAATMLTIEMTRQRIELSVSHFLWDQHVDEKGKEPLAALIATVCAIKSNPSAHH